VIKIQKYYQISVEKKQRKKTGEAYIAQNEYWMHKILVPYSASTVHIGFVRNTEGKRPLEDLDVDWKILKWMEWYGLDSSGSG
jgi:hypothetical protein